MQMPTKIQTSNVWRCPKLMHLQNPLEPGSGLDSNPSSTHSKPLALNWKSKDKFDPQYELPQGQQLVTHGFDLAPVQSRRCSKQSFQRLNVSQHTGPWFVVLVDVARYPKGICSRL